MMRIVVIERQGDKANDAAYVPPSDSVRLDHDQRSRRRMVFRTEGGVSILLDMARPAGLHDGDVLRLEDGAGVVVAATAEALLDIGATSTAELVRIAWHLGNRHLPTQLVPGTDGGTLRIRHDHVIAEMVSGLGGTVQSILAPFDPEGGAYARGEHDHGHMQGHSHSHADGDPDHHDDDPAHHHTHGHRHVHHHG